jgi:hypothetical protein
VEYEVLEVHSSEEYCNMKIVGSNPTLARFGISKFLHDLAKLPGRILRRIEYAYLIETNQMRLAELLMEESD